MGLDMYLSKKTYVKNWEHLPKSEHWNISVKRGGKPADIQPKRISYIEEEVAYWRKANQIHKWFVDNVQDGKDDCGSYFVSRETLEHLLELVNEVLENPNSAQELLPTESGCFFGSTDYGDSYREDLEYTHGVLTELLEEKGEHFYYQSSW